MKKSDGMNYAPTGKVNKVVGENEFVFSVIGLKHGHIFGMTNGLLEAGATIKFVYDEDMVEIEEFIAKYPQARRADSQSEILFDQDTKLVASAEITNLRAKLGCLVMKHGKDFFTDKTGCTTLDDLALIEKTCLETKHRFFVYFSERLHVESAVYAQQLISQNKIGSVIQVIGLGPHRLDSQKRPSWFFEHEKYGGILCDIGSHQIEQFLFFAGCQDAKIVSSNIANYNHPQFSELEDFGDCSLVGDNGAIGYFRVDWFTPNGLSSWGDGRLFILGTNGYIELRKYVDIANSSELDNVYLVNQDGEYKVNVNGKMGFPFFGQMILDCLNKSENAMTQKHILTALRLCICAQNMASRVKHNINSEYNG